MEINYVLVIMASVLWQSLFTLCMTHCILLYT